MPTCEVCQTTQAIVVASVPGVPYSAAYCRKCLDADAHPMFILVANTACCGSLAECGQEWRDMVDHTLVYLGKTREWFEEQVRQSVSEMDRYFEEKDKASDPMLDAAKACSIALSMVPQRMWAELFVELKMAFFRKFARGLICSTTHGLDWFDNIVAACEGRLEWDEKGEYGENFRKMIAGRPRV